MKIRFFLFFNIRSSSLEFIFLDLSLRCECDNMVVKIGDSDDIDLMTLRHAVVEHS